MLSNSKMIYICVELICDETTSPFLWDFSEIQSRKVANQMKKFSSATTFSWIINSSHTNNLFPFCWSFLSYLCFLLPLSETGAYAMSCIGGCRCSILQTKFQNSFMFTYTHRKIILLQFMIIANGLVKQYLRYMVRCMVHFESDQCSKKCFFWHSLISLPFVKFLCHWMINHEICIFPIQNYVL